jgi:hypothetical protein
MERPKQYIHTRFLPTLAFQNNKKNRKDFYLLYIK